jgi:endonuclease/exonuclease/phosphatase family metal-dependent hydrolase
MLSSRRLRLTIVLLTAGAALASAGAGIAQAHSKVEVMTRNMYIGADLTPLIAAQTLPEFLAATGQAYTNVLASDPPARIRAMAREIDKTDPEIVGLQEVALFQTDTVPPVLDGPATPATTTSFDFLQMLLDALADRRAHYTVLTISTNSATEAPTSLGFDVKLTDRDVLLARSDLSPRKLSWSNASSAHFAVNLTLPSVAGPITFTRGYNVADFTAKKRTFRVVNTHLEPAAEPVQDAQAAELLAGPLSTGPRSQILIGDINSDPGATGTNPYDMFAAAGFADTWTETHRRDPGLTCCFGELLLDADASVFDERIDVVLTRGARKRATSAKIVGTDPRNRTPSGRWPSDHAGVVSAVRP